MRGAQAAPAVEGGGTRDAAGDAKGAGDSEAIDAAKKRLSEK